MKNFEVTIRDGECSSVRIVSAPTRGAARWLAVDALRWVGFDTRDALRAVPSVRGATKPNPDQALAAECAAWNAAHPVGTRVRYWTGVKEGEGAVGEVRAPARVICGHVAAWVDTYHSCVAVSHIEALDGAGEVENDDV